MIAINKELNIPGFIALNWNVRIQQNKKRILKILTNKQTDILKMKIKSK